MRSPKANLPRVSPRYTSVMESTESRISRPDIHALLQGDDDDDDDNEELGAGDRRAASNAMGSSTALTPTSPQARQSASKSAAKPPKDKALPNLPRLVLPSTAAHGPPVPPKTPRSARGDAAAAGVTAITIPVTPTSARQTPVTPKAGMASRARAAANDTADPLQNVPMSFAFARTSRNDQLRLPTHGPGGTRRPAAGGTQGSWAPGGGTGTTIQSRNNGSLYVGPNGTLHYRTTATMKSRVSQAPTPTTNVSGWLTGIYKSIVHGIDPDDEAGTEPAGVDEARDDDQPQDHPELAWLAQDDDAGAAATGASAAGSAGTPMAADAEAAAAAAVAAAAAPLVHPSLPAGVPK